MSQPSSDAARPSPPAGDDERTRAIRALPPPATARPVRFTGNRVAGAPHQDEAFGPAQPRPTAVPGPASGAPTRPAPAVGAPAPSGAARPASGSGTPAVDQPTDQLPGGTGRPEGAPTIRWLAGPGPGPLPYPRVVPRRRPGRALALLLLLVLVAVALVLWLR